MIMPFRIPGRLLFIIPDPQNDVIVFMHDAHVDRMRLLVLRKAVLCDVACHFFQREAGQRGTDGDDQCFNGLYSPTAVMASMPT